MMIKFKGLLGALLLGLGCCSYSYAANNDTIHFGIYATEKPSSDVISGWQNMVTAMEDASGESVKMSIYLSPEKIVHDLDSGKLGMVYLEHAASTLAMKKNHAISLFGTALTQTPVTGQLSLVYTSYIIVAKNSTISRIASLKNKKIAFVSLDSEGGHIQVEKELAKAHVINVHWVKYATLDDAFNAVHNGDASALGVWDHALLSREDQENFKVIDTIKNLPNPALYVNTKVITPATQKKLMAALSNTKGPYNIMGFVKPGSKIPAAKQ